MISKTLKPFCFLLGKERGPRNSQNFQNLFIQFVSGETKITLKPWAIPSINLPGKSTYLSSTIIKPREPTFKINEKKDWSDNTKISNVCSKSHKEFAKRALNLKFCSDCNSQQINSIVYVIKSDEKHMVPLCKIFFGHSLKFQIRVLANNLSCENVFLSNFAYSLNSCNICQGIKTDSSIDYSLLVKHSIQKLFVPYQENKLLLHESNFY